MRSVVNDTGKKNDEKQIGEMEKVFTKNALYTQNISKKKLAFISLLERK